MTKVYLRFSNYSCLDIHFHCPSILELNPSACDYSEDNAHYDFMRVACMKTCNICGDEVTLHVYFDVDFIKQISWAGL